MYCIYVYNYLYNLSKSTYLLLVPLAVFLVSVSFHKPVDIKSFVDGLLNTQYEIDKNLFG